MPAVRRGADGDAGRELEQVERRARVAVGVARDGRAAHPRRPCTSRSPSPRSRPRARGAGASRGRPRSSGRSTNTLDRDSSAAFTSNDGFSVVAPTRTMSPASTRGRKASCCALLKRWISSMKRMVRRPSRRRAASASAITALMSLMPASTALKATKCACVVAASMRARVVLPVPGGPQRMIDCSASRSMASRSGLPGATRCCLADELVQRARAHAVGQRRPGSARPSRVRLPRRQPPSPIRRRRVEEGGPRQRLGLPAPRTARCPSATATLSDSTPSRIGMRTSASARVRTASSQAATLASHRRAMRARPASLVEHCGRAGVERDDVDARALEGRDGSFGGRLDADGQAQGAAHRSAQGLPSERIRARPRAHDSRGAGGIGRPDDRADVARVLHAVHHDDAHGRRAGDHAGERGGVEPRQRHHR